MKDNKGNVKALVRIHRREKQPLDLRFQANSHTGRLVLAQENKKPYTQAN